MKNIIIISFFFIILITPLVFGAEVISDPTLRNLIVTEEEKTRSEIKNYFDTKSNQLLVVVTDNAQEFIDTNFQILDNQIKKQINLFFIKAVIGIIASIVFSQLVWFLIKRKIQSIKKRRRKKLDLESATPNPNGF